MYNGPVSAVETVLHPDYNPATFKNDIALLRLESPLHHKNNSGFARLAPPIYKDFNNLGMNLLRHCVSVGWGSAMVHCTDVTPVHIEYCRTKNHQLYPMREINSNIFCTTKGDSIDSGGSVICNNFLYGVTIWQDSSVGLTVNQRIDRNLRFIFDSAIVKSFNPGLKIFHFKFIILINLICSFLL